MELLRRAVSLSLRFLLSLALVLAVLPLRASVATCVSPQPRPSCAMPCCAAKVSSKRVVCCGAQRRLEKRVSCGCELRSSSDVPAPNRATVVPGFDAQHLLASPTTPVLASSGPIETLDPGRIGIDSGPPKDVPRRASPPRAPPVARD